MVQDVILILNCRKIGSDPGKRYNQGRKHRHETVLDQYQTDQQQIMEHLQNEIQTEIEQVLRLVVNPSII
jgi:hypothetical protein